ncbi:MAG: glycosyltransferase family 1 protein [Rhodoferax sp.]|uniref:glycosyltransferase family 4 protein n=1 Tax=Rhodoferax sp. TaxID=50421 RepID=UPI00262AF71E|nr:glycosyltransferase family 1 protein [Rhodoferax sp.]MDD2882227.1 glycosyltransferase family 1 protein [Rhodoferax sp.]
MHYGLSIEKGIHLPSERTAQTLSRVNALAQRFVPYPRTARRLAEKAMFAYQTKFALRDALYHEPNYVPMPFDGPLVLTICDMSCFDHPETHPQERVRLMQGEMPKALERADHILVISESSGRALQRWFDVPSEKITTTYLAADARFRPYDPVALAQPLAELNLSAGGYVLCVGTLEPRKNLTTLFAAYAGLPAALRREYPLVVAGMSGWNTQELMASAQALIEKGELRLLGYVPDALIPPLYAGAAAFCYPSRYEGFGLPALEAMASGVPVLTANQTSLPEVVGDAGLMVAPDDVEGMRDSLQRMLEDRVFAQALSKKGLERAKTFSWERCAQETVGVYNQVMRDRGRVV